MKRSLVLALLVIMASSIAAVAPAETTIRRTAPYDVGKVCYELNNAYLSDLWSWNDQAGCITDPYGGDPNPITNPLPHKMFIGTAMAARSLGALGGGGKTRDYDCNWFTPCHNIYYAALTRIETQVTAGFAPNNGTITATADLTGISVDVNDPGRICLQILQWNNVAGQSCVQGVQDGLNGTLTATATTTITAKYKIIVFYDVSGRSDHSVGAVRVGSISYAW